MPTTTAAIFRLANGNVASAVAKSAIASPLRMSPAPIVGMSTNVVSIVPAMLPTVDRAYSVPAVLPTDATVCVASRTANGETMPMPMLGSRNSTADATNGPDFSPKLPSCAMAEQTGPAMPTITNSDAATAMTIELSSAREGCRSASSPPR